MTSTTWSTSSYEKNPRKKANGHQLVVHHPTPSSSLPKPFGMSSNQQQHVAVTTDHHHQLRSHSIPLPSHHVHRTESEVQLEAGLEAAERRNLRMYYRLVNGPQQQQLGHNHNNNTAEPIQHHHEFRTVPATDCRTLLSSSWNATPAQVVTNMHTNNNNNNTAKDHVESNQFLENGDDDDDDDIRGSYGRRRSASAPPAPYNSSNCNSIADSDDWSISGFSEKQQLQQQRTLDDDDVDGDQANDENDDDFESDGVFDMDL